MKDRNYAWVLFFWKSSCKHFYKVNQDGNIAQLEEDDGYKEIGRDLFKEGNVGILIKPIQCFLSILELLIFEFDSS